MHSDCNIIRIPSKYGDCCHFYTSSYSIGQEPKDFGNGIVRPSVLETDSPLYKGYKSAMVYAKITPKELADEVFSLNYLSRVDELR